MSRLVSVSTGCFYRFNVPKNETLKIISGLLVDGVEISFQDSKSLFDFELSEINLSFLQNKPFVTIHAPDDNVVYGENQQAIETLDRLENLYRVLNAKNIVFHAKPGNDFKILSNYSFKSSLENDDWRKGKETNTVFGISDLLKKYPKLGFVLDIGHANSMNQNEIEGFINTFKKELSEIHFSYVNKDKKEHDLISRGYNIDNLNLISLTNAPFVIESPIDDLSELNLLEKEIALAKSF